MKIATFNINNINKRLANLLAWLEAARPDVVCLQELKAADTEFPRQEIDKAGYGAVWRGEKSWNGVAILARGSQPVVTRTELPGDASDNQSRYIEAAVNGVLVTSIYAPNGNPQPGPKFSYKLAWMERLQTHAAELYAAGVPVVLAGDYNVVPTEFDIYQTKSYARNALVQPASRAAFRSIAEHGWIDAIRALHPDEPMYTFWDYLRNRWPRDAGLRLDHLLLSESAAKRLVAAGVDREVRGEEGASDHAPAWIELSDKASGSRRRAGKPVAKKAASKADARPRPTRSPRAKAAADDRPLLVIDGDSFTHRHYHALPKTILRKGGKQAGAIVGFANFLLRLYAQEKPRAVIVAWDTLEVPTYRHKLFPKYQSGRHFDRPLLEQLNTLPELVAACGFQNAKAAGYEADDFLAAAATAEEKRGGEWDGRLRLSETQAEGAFTQTFFVDTWRYGEAGRVSSDQHTIIAKLPVPGEGAGGGAGEADLALGWFRGRRDAIPQVLCEFKDIRSKLDAKQNRKGSTRSPIEQCLNYVRGARRGLFGNEPVQPWWGLVTDMNEFRLYWWDRAPTEYIRFVIRREDLLSGAYDLLSESEDARFDRYLFAKLFSRDMLLSEAGRPLLLRLVERQWSRERKLEGEFYDRYKDVRERLYKVLGLSNPSFPGRPSELLRLTQKLLDRFIFSFFCEDMGERLLFPPQLIRDFMRNRSNEPFYDENGSELWEQFKRVFEKMNTGGPLNRVTLPEINGGLFEPDPLIDGLDIPNHVFAKAGQGANEASLESDQETLLYLCGRYNYAARGDVKESLSLYTLGHIFEQSITELEYREGELEGRETVAKLSKRKRDGVYYTPEPVVNYLVEQTLGPWFADARAACGYPGPDEGIPTAAAAAAYVERLKTVRIVDPACGSGAFLISAFRRLLAERIAAARDVERAQQGTPGAIGEASIIAEILRDNIYGVDINPASVEIAKLALWLHSARASSPLSSLGHTIRIGNSLVGEDFWTARTKAADDEERVRTFDWRAAFPEVWPAGRAGGFDIVLGNPPYVKLQNLMKVDPDVVAYLTAERGSDTYQSARTGNFDLYLPFIEKGLRLLGPGGRMAFIAPSPWTVNQYGEGLRSLVRRGRYLDRWLDFKAHQVFEDVITYTALQFFTREARDVVRIAAAPNGEMADIEWSEAELAVAYETLPENGEWLMATGAERALIERLSHDCLRLDDPSLTTAIFQGLITSADYIYHLERLGAGRYKGTPKRKGATSYEVDLEDAIMKPLVSGPEAKRYEEPETDTYLLFPYERDSRGAMHLISADDMARRYVKAWAHLRKWEKELRGRENGKMDRDQDWWGYVYPKNLDKHDIPKLIVPRLVRHLKAGLDESKTFYLDNVDVGGVVPSSGADPAYLLSVLNGPVCDFIFRIIAKPFQNDYRSANKQFIAPLPIPNAPAQQRSDVGNRARRLQERWTHRRDLLQQAADRLSVLPRAGHPARWLWPNLPILPEMMEQAPRALRLTTDRRKWANERLDEMEAARVEALQAALNRGGRREVRFDGGELRLYVSGAAVLDKIYLDDAAARLAEAYWRWLLLKGPTREARRFAADLRNPPAPSDAPAASQFIERVAALAAEVAAIEADERALNEILYDLYGLSPDERNLVENEPGRRNAALVGG